MIKKCKTTLLNSEIAVALYDDKQVQVGKKHVDADGYVFIHLENDKVSISTLEDYRKQETGKKSKATKGTKKTEVEVVLDKEE